MTASSHLVRNWSVRRAVGQPLPLWGVTSLLAAVTAGARAHAQTRTPPVSGGEAVVRGDPFERDRARVEGGARFATSIDLRNRGRVAESVGEMLDEAPGLHVRRAGDGFAPQSMTLRGAPAAHVTVALDGVVLNDAATDGVDLSLLPPSLVERADIYRGSAPVRLGVSGLGGALELVTRRPSSPVTLWFTGGAGSFGARRTTGFVGANGRRLQGLLAVSYRGSDGDYPFYDDHGTPTNIGSESVRQNNASDALDVLYRACVRFDALGEQPVCVLTLTGWRRREVPGVGAFQTDGPFAEQKRILARVGVPVQAGALRLEGFATVMAREDLFVNRGAVLLPGTGAFDTRQGTVTIEGGAQGTFARSFFTVDFSVRGRNEAFSARQQGPTGVSEASRRSLVAGLEATLRWSSLRIVPALGFELMGDRSDTARTSRALFSPRVGYSWQVVRGLELRANGGLYQRAPTLPELYGDRGLTEGNPALRPERALNGDLGAVVTLDPGRWRIRTEVAGFARDVEDLIAFVQTSRTTFRPFNIESARVWGVEAQVRATWRRKVQLLASYAFVDPRVHSPGGATDGNLVPGLAAHDFYASGAVSIGGAASAPGLFALGANVSFTSEAWLDVSNTREVPARWLVGASAAWTPWFARALTLSATITNLFDVRVAQRLGTTPGVGRIYTPIQDFFGYPLPGRAFFVALTAQTDS